MDNMTMKAETQSPSQRDRQRYVHFVLQDIRPSAEICSILEE